jgi:glycosyltransferase involved in cell wall biosynthesis
MLAGTIPIASKLGGVPEIIRGTYAEKMMFTPGDVDELVDKMEEVMSLSREQLIDIGAGLRESALRKFDVNIIKGQMLDVFHV